MEKKILERWIDVYTTYEESEASLITGVLENEGIPCRVESARISAFPVAVGKLGELRVLVHMDDFEKAKKALELARAEEEEAS